MRKNKFGLGLFILGISILITTNFTITGGVIDSNFQFSFYQILGLLLIIGSFVLFVKKHSLDAIIIPTGGDYLGRAKKAEKEKDKLKEEGYFVISGIVHDEKDPAKKRFLGSQSDKVYRDLRKHGILRSDIEIESESRNTIENIIYSLEKIKKKGGREIGIASYPGHLDRFEKILEKAKEEGIVDNHFNIYRLETRTKETPKEKIYETLSGILQRYKLRKGVKESLKSEDEPVIKYLKKAGSAILKLFER